MRQAGEDSKPLLEYYLFNTGGSLRSVLNDTGTVDLNQVTDQASSAKDDVVQKVREEFHLKGKVCRAQLVNILSLTLLTRKHQL